MSNREMVVKVLKEYGAMTARQIAVQINNKMGIVLTSAQIAGAMRPLIAQGKAANSKDGSGKTVYWMNKEEW